MQEYLGAILGKPGLRFSIHKIGSLAERYGEEQDDKNIAEMRPKVLRRGYLTKSELHDVAYWKAPRSAGHVEKNDEDYIEEITRFALATKCERARVESLTLLDGVSWPTASVILHWFHRDPYPILDFRAVWSASFETPAQYNFPFWWSYVEFCRGVARSADVDMRSLDRALWQYSKENQRAQKNK